MMSTGDLSQLAVLLNILGYKPASGGGSVTPQQVQTFAFNYEPATGVNDAFIVNLDPPVTVLTDGLIVSMSTGTLENETASPTLQVNALAPVSIELWAGALAPGDIETNASYLFIYNAADNTFQLINPSLTTANSFLVQESSYNTAIDNGAANAYDVTLLLAPQVAPTLGFPVYMRVGAGNTNTGASTLTVNGVTDNIILNNGSAIPAGSLVSNQLAYLIHNGTDWVLNNPPAIGQLKSLQVFTAGGTWNRPVGINSVSVELVAGGGGSGGGAATGVGEATSSGGGGGGGYSRRLIDVTSTASVTVTVGAAGTAGGVGNSAGGAGGTSSFGALVSATGGGGGAGSPNATSVGSTAGNGGIGIGGDLNVNGSCGIFGRVTGGAVSLSNNGGGSYFSGASLVRNVAGSGLPGLQYGGGASGGRGGASSSAYGGAVGAAGVVIVYEYS